MSEESAKLSLLNLDAPDEIPVLHGHVTSGMPLPVAARKRITQCFETMLGCHVLLTCCIDKSLIAGIRVEINGCEYDGSLLGQLKNVRKMLMRHDEEGL